MFSSGIALNGQPTVNSLPWEWPGCTPRRPARFPPAVVPGCLRPAVKSIAIPSLLHHSSAGLRHRAAHSQSEPPLPCLGLAAEDRASGCSSVAQRASRLSVTPAHEIRFRKLKICPDRRSGCRISSACLSHSGSAQNRPAAVTAVWIYKTPPSSPCKNRLDDSS